MKKLIVILVLCAAAFSSKAQTNPFPNTDSLVRYINRWIRNSPVEAFQNLRMNTALIGIIRFLEAGSGGGGGNGIDTAYAINDSTLRITTDLGLFTITLKGGADVDTLYRSGDSLRFTISGRAHAVAAATNQTIQQVLNTGYTIVDANDSIVVAQNNTFGLYGSNNTIINFQSTGNSTSFGHLRLDNDGFLLRQRNLGTGLYKGLQGNSLSNTGISVFDQGDLMGLGYAANYRTNGIANFGDRWIPDLGATKRVALDTSAMNDMAYNSAWKGDTLVWFAHSYGKAIGASDSAHGANALIAARLGVALKNVSVAGSTVMRQNPINYQGAASFYERVNQIPVNSANIVGVVVEGGLNDAGQTAAAYTPANYALAWDSIFSYIIDTLGYPRSKVALMGLEFIGQTGLNYYATVTSNAAPTYARMRLFDSVNRATALRWGIRFIPMYDKQLYNGDTTDLDVNGVHPTDDGYAFIADQFLQKMSLGSGGGGSSGDFIENGTGAQTADFNITGTGIFSTGSGTNRSIGMSATPVVDNFGALTFYPATGTNVGAAFSMSPRGTGLSSALKSQIGVFGTDFVADGTNYEGLIIRAVGDAFNIFASQGGSGSVRPINIFTGNTNNGQLTLFTNGNVGTTGSFTADGDVGIGTNAPAAKLHIYQSGTTNAPRVRIDNNGASGNFGIDFYSGATYKAGFYVDNIDDFNVFTADNPGTAAWKVKKAGNTLVGFELQVGSSTDQGAYTFQNTGDLFQMGRVFIGGTPGGNGDYKLLVHNPDSSIGQVNILNALQSNGEYTINTTTTDATPIGTTLSILGPSGQSAHLDCTFTAVLDDGNGGYTAKKTRGFLKNAGGTVSAGTQVSVNADEYYGSGLSTATSALGTVSGNPGYTITGESGKTIFWTIKIKVTLSAAAL